MTRAFGRDKLAEEIRNPAVREIWAVGAFAMTAGVRLQPKHDRPTILIVDDDVQFLRHLSVILRNASYDVVEASDGERAVEILERLREGIALVIVDLVLPGSLNGFEIIGALTRRPHPVKILATSAIMKQPQLYSAMRVGADGVIQKPPHGEAIPKDEWLETVRQLLAGAEPG